MFSQIGKDESNCRQICQVQDDFLRGEADILHDEGKAKDPIQNDPSPAERLSFTPLLFMVLVFIHILHTFLNGFATQKLLRNDGILTNVATLSYWRFFLDIITLILPYFHC